MLTLLLAPQHNFHLNDLLLTEIIRSGKTKIVINSRRFLHGDLSG